ncbi:MAG: hypothetical protein KKH44_10845 [Bacteroidetes bacterium]|nr:hypothetical protein [Bacteroidota bacterium]
MIRLYQDKDDAELENMLITEGIPTIEMAYKQYKTFIFEEDKHIKGFFTIKREWGYPSIQHFCVNRKNRSPLMARKIAKAMKITIKEMGFNRAILHSKNNITDKFISYFFKKQPYAIKNITTFFFVEV